MREPILQSQMSCIDQTCCGCFSLYQDQDGRLTLRCNECDAEAGSQEAPTSEQAVAQAAKRWQTSRDRFSFSDDAAIDENTDAERSLDAAIRAWEMGAAARAATPGVAMTDGHAWVYECFNGDARIVRHDEDGFSDTAIIPADQRERLAEELTRPRGTGSTWTNPNLTPEEQDTLTASYFEPLEETLAAQPLATPDAKLLRDAARSAAMLVLDVVQSHGDEGDSERLSEVSHYARAAGHWDDDCDWETVAAILQSFSTGQHDASQDDPIEAISAAPPDRTQVEDAIDRFADAVTTPIVDGGIAKEVAARAVLRALLGIGPDRTKIEAAINMIEFTAYCHGKIAAVGGDLPEDVEVRKHHHAALLALLGIGPDAGDAS